MVHDSIEKAAQYAESREDKRQSVALIKFVASCMSSKIVDAELVAWARACHDAYMALVANIEDNRIREQLLAEQSEQVAECTRNLVLALDAMEAGELVPVLKQRGN